LACCAALLLARKGWLHWVFMAFLLVMSVFTSARTGIVAFILLLGISLFLKRESLRSKAIKAVAIVAIAVIALGVFSILRPQSQFTANDRIMTYQAGWDNFVARPLTGSGLGFLNYKESPSTEHVFPELAQFPNNTYLQVLAQGGLFSALCFLAYLAFLIPMIAKNDRAAFLGFLCACLGALFIPDVMNIRFFPLIIALGLFAEAPGTSVLGENSVGGGASLI
jgi:O-antigen ligase